MKTVDAYFMPDGSERLASIRECIVMIVERGDGNYDSTSLFLYIRQFYSWVAAGMNVMLNAMGRLGHHIPGA